MSVLLYAVADGPPDSAGATGLDEQPLRTVAREGLTAVVSDVAAEPSPDIANLWAYHEVVMRLMAGTPLLPARFGTTADDDDAVKTMLAERRAEFLGTLQRVGDRVEYAVSAPPAEDEPPQTGTAYMERLLAREQSTRALEAAAGSLVCDVRRTPHGTAYLVERDDAEAFVARAADLGLTVTGPWPPYSFVSPA